MPTAGDLLAGIESSTGSDLLFPTRNETAPPGHTFISQFDDLLGLSKPHTESPLSRCDVIELQGPACSGKTQLLYFLAMTAVLPPVWRGAAIGGKGKGVIWFDCDGRFDAGRVAAMVESHLRRRVGATPAPAGGPPPPPAAFQNEVRSCLGKIHIFTPASSLGLALALRWLRTYHRTRMADVEVIYLIVDSISAFHWQDLYRLEEAKPAAHPHPLTYVLSALEETRRALGCVAFLSNWVLSHPVLPSSAAANDPPAQHLAPPYPRPFGGPLPTGPLPGLRLSHHVSLHKPPAYPFMNGTSLRAAREGKAARDAAIANGRVVCVLRSAVDIDIGNERTRGQGRAAGTQEWREMGRFDFGVRDWGLDAP